jgi:hypothetical protein
MCLESVKRRIRSFPLILQRYYKQYNNRGFLLLLLFILAICAFVFIASGFSSSGRGKMSRVAPILRNGRKITVATVACGQSVNEALTLIKSAIIFSQDAQLHVIVFSDSARMNEMTEKVSFREEFIWSKNHAVKTRLRISCGIFSLLVAPAQKDRFKSASGRFHV